MIDKWLEPSSNITDILTDGLNFLPKKTSTLSSYIIQSAQVYTASCFYFILY